MNRFAAAKGFGLIALLSAFFLSSQSASAQALTFAGNPQHTGLYTTPAQPANTIKWQTLIEQNTNAAEAHYGMPCITAANTVFVPVHNTSNGYQVDAFNGADGSSKYSLTSDYIMPTYSWVPVYNPCVTNGPSGSRVWYAGAGGTLFYVDGADSNTPASPVRVAFYGNANYAANTSGFNSTVFVDTPITSDSNGTVYFGFRVQGTAPSPMNTGQSGYARIDSSGNGTYVLVGDASGDIQIMRDSHNAAPCLSNDGQTLYVVCKWATNAYYGYLLGLDSTTLTTKYKVFLKDPRNNNSTNAGILDDSTASPMVGPDNEVFLGVFGNPYNGSRGWLLHFSPDLSVEYTPGAFGWDSTPAIVPATMVPSYHGPSSYLLFTKYNNYANVTDGDGINKVAILDPNSSQLDPHPTAPGQVEMREVMTMIGVTPDSENPGTPNAIREWCINSSLVNPATGCVYFDSEDGHMYSWDLTANSLNQSVSLTSGIGEPYVPTTMGPDGTIYTLNGTYMFAIGNNTNTGFALRSSAESARTVVAGDNLTFTATVTGGVGTPTGTVTFTDLTYNGQNQETVTLGTVTLDGTGQAALSTNALAAGGAYLGNHWITASYSGDGGHAALSTTRIQKVHAFSSVTSVTSSSGTSNFGDNVTFTATVTSAEGTPTGMVLFQEGNTILAQVPLSGGAATFSTAFLSGGAHTISAAYYGDTQSATSSGSFVQHVAAATTTTATFNPSSSSYGQAVTFNVTVVAVNPLAGIPTGTVSISGFGQTFGSAPLDATGHATIVISNFPVGNNGVYADFSGSGGWGFSDSAGMQELVSEGTSVSVASNNNPSALNSLVTFTATVTPAVVGGGIPSGTVSFMDGPTFLGNATTNASGSASLSTSSLGVGSHSITGVFTSGIGWNASTSAPLVQNVTAGTTLALASNLNPSKFGAVVTFTATAASGGGVPTGSVTFTDGATTLGTASVNGSGVATYSTGALTVATHTIGATFTGTNFFNNSVAATLSQVVQTATTATAVVSNANPSVKSQLVTFTATVTSNGGIPVGKVAFKNGTTTLTTLNLDGMGRAIYSTSTLAVGTRKITVVFTGSTGYGNSTSPVLNQVVNNDTTAPSVPGGVTAVSGPGAKQIKISWSPCTDNSGVVTYDVYRATSLLGTFSRIASNIAPTTYTDTLASSNLTRYYYVIARDPTNNRSAASAKVSAKSL